MQISKANENQLALNQEMSNNPVAGDGFAELLQVLLGTGLTNLQNQTVANGVSGGQQPMIVEDVLEELLVANGLSGGQQPIIAGDVLPLEQLAGLEETYGNTDDELAAMASTMGLLLQSMTEPPAGVIPGQEMTGNSLAATVITGQGMTENSLAAAVIPLDDQLLEAVQGELGLKQPPKNMVSSQGFTEVSPEEQTVGPPVQQEAKKVEQAPAFIPVDVLKNSQAVPDSNDNANLQMQGPVEKNGEPVILQTKGNDLSQDSQQGMNNGDQATNQIIKKPDILVQKDDLQAVEELPVKPEMPPTNLKGLEAGQKATSNPEVQLNQLPVRLTEMVKSMMLQHNPGSTSLKMKLQPEHLGEVTVKLTWSKGELSAQFITSTGVAREALESSFPQLKQLLAQQDIRLSEAAVFMEQQTQQWDHGSQGSNQRWQFRGQTKANRGYPVGTDILQPVAANQTAAANPGLNIVV